MPFGAVMLAMWIFAGVAGALAPQAQTFNEVWRVVWPELKTLL
jgi:hypothetical protein